LKFILAHILGLNFILLTDNISLPIGAIQSVVPTIESTAMADESSHENPQLNATEDITFLLQSLKSLISLWAGPVEKTVEEEKVVEKKIIPVKPNSEDKEKYQRLINELKAKLLASNDINASLLNHLNDVQEIVDIKNDQINTLQNANKTLQKANKTLSIENSPAIKSDIELVKEAIASEPDIIKFEPSLPSPDKPIVDIEDKADEDIYEELPKLSNFSGSVEFGFSYSENTIKTRDINGRFIATYEEKQNFKLNSEINFELREEDNNMTANNMRWQLQGDRYFNSRNFMYVNSDLLRSRFTSYDKEDTFTIGYGRVILAQEKNELNIEIGSGYRRALPNIDTDASAESVDEAIVSFGVYNKHSLSSTLQIGLDNELELGMENTIYSTSLKLQNKIYRQLFLISESNYKYIKNVPDGTSNNDLSTTLKLKYAF